MENEFKYIGKVDADKLDKMGLFGFSIIDLEKCYQLKRIADNLEKVTSKK